MKLFLSVLAIIAITTTLLTACGAKTSGVNTPSLSTNSAPTSRIPSPSNFQRNVMMDSSTMTVPQRP